MNRIVIYSTDPVHQVVGEVEVIGTITMKPTPLWEATKNAAGISRAKFRAYFKGSDTACAFKLGQTLVYKNAKSLTELGINSAPQSFVYLKDE